MYISFGTNALEQDAPISWQACRRIAILDDVKQYENKVEHKSDVVDHKRSQTMSQGSNK